MLCAAGLRALVEGICADRKVKRGPVKDQQSGKVNQKTNLEGKINGLVGIHEEHELSAANCVRVQAPASARTSRVTYSLKFSTLVKKRYPARVATSSISGPSSSSSVTG